MHSWAFSHVLNFDSCYLNYYYWALNCAVVVVDADSIGVAGDDFAVDDDAFAVPEVDATGAGAAGVA